MFVSAVHFDRNFLSLFVRRVAPVSFLCVLLPLSVQASPFNCKTNHCGLLTRGNNPDIVIGTVERVADAKDMRKVFHWARTHGYWKDLSSDKKGYLKSVKLLSLSVASPDRRATRSITVLMTPKEFNSMVLKSGDQVRYSPHDAAHERNERPKNPKARAYWDLVGCVAMICGKKDRSCRTRFRSGVYRRDNGREVDPATGGVLADGARIDPVSLFTVSGAKIGHAVPARKQEH